VTEQHGSVRFGRIAEDVFDPRSLARAPGDLEPVARQVDFGPDPGGIDPAI
jgi:hypothetical protein